MAKKTKSYRKKKEGYAPANLGADSGASEGIEAGDPVPAANEKETKVDEPIPTGEKAAKSRAVETIEQIGAMLGSSAPSPLATMIEALTTMATTVAASVSEALPEPIVATAQPVIENVVEEAAPQGGKALAPARFSLLGADDLHLFNEGKHHRLYEHLGAHVVRVNGIDGTSFGVWAPNAAAVSVIGTFNGWDKKAHPMRRRDQSGIWEAFIPGVLNGVRYKYSIVSQFDHYTVDKSDPFAFRTDNAPGTASVVTSLDYSWDDAAWMKSRNERQSLKAPMSTYEVHLGSWRRCPEENDRMLTYRELAPLLASYVKENGFTHVELMPVMEHPYYGSWGYQITGFFAASSRYGSPQDLMYLIDHLHQNEIGVILDWVPSHFPTDEHGLSFFDGTHLFEHADPRQGFHPDWGSLIFNYGRNEVRSFLLSAACFWLDRFHIDGLRFDAVASMLYLDYSRKAGEWIPNVYGGRENLEAVAFLRELNEAVYAEFSGVQTIAEESTAWPLVSRPNYLGGLGFGMKWDMGWMHDTLRFMSTDPFHRRAHHNSMTFRTMYAFTENFVLPLSHDEVVHGKGSLIRKMPGDDWQRFANLRLLFGYMFAQPGKKLLFMGGEIGQWREWSHERSLDWDLLERPLHSGLQQWVRDLNHSYRSVEALHVNDFSADGFEWIDANDSDQSVLSFLRKGVKGDDDILVVLNFTPVVRVNYQLGVPGHGIWRELLNSDSPEYGGSGQGNAGGVEALPVERHGRPFSITLTLPPLGALFLRREDLPAPVKTASPAKVVRKTSARTGSAKKKDGGR